MSKRKKLNRLAGLTPNRNYENYNPLLEEDNRVSRRFGLGLVASVAVNMVILGGAGVMASKLPITKADELPPIDILYTPPAEPKTVATPAPPQVAQATPPPPVEMVPPPPPEPERQREPERVRPTPPPEPEQARPTPPPPVQVAKAEREKPIIPTPEPVVTPPPPTRLEEQKPDEVTVKTEASEQRKAEAATSVAQRVAQIPEATTQAKALKSELGVTDAVTAPTRNRSIREPIGASTTVASARKSLAELREEAASAGGGGNPVSVSAAGAAAPGSGSVTGARAVPATSASNDRSLSANTASAGNASVLDSTPTRSIRGPIASTGPLSARSKVLQSLSSDAEDSNSFSFVPGGTVTAGKVVGTQGATARGTVITSASGVAQPQFAGANNGVTVATPGGVPIRGPRIAAGSPGLAGPRARTAVALGDIGGQQGAPGTFNSALPGGGGVSGSGTGGAGGAGGVGGSGSLRARGGSIAGTGGGSGGGELRAQRSGADAVASSRPGRPRDGAIAANGAAFGGKARGPQLSTTSIGGLEGPSGGAGDVDGTPGGLGRAGKSTGRAGAVDGAATGGTLGAKRGTGGSDTIASNGDGNGRGTGIKEEKTDTSGPGSKLQRSENAIATFKPEPDIPDSMRSEQFATSAGVHVKISESGRATYELTRSSGSSVIDRIVTQTVSRWKWKPAIRNGVPTASETDITVSLRVR